MRVLVTGASGLIGGRLLRHLAGSDVQVRAASRAVRVWPQGVEGCLVDFGRPTTLHQACVGVDAVVNLASMPADTAEQQPRQALLATGGGVFSLLDAAVQTAVPRFVQVSTSKVYGPRLVDTVTEETGLRPRSHYAIIHALAENYVSHIHPDSIVFRLANGFGAPVSLDVPCWSLVVNDMCRQAVETGRIAIRSSGESRRNFIPIGDVVVALHRAATGGIPPGIYNLGGVGSMTLKAMAMLVADVCRYTLDVDVRVTVGTPSEGLAPVGLDYRIDKLDAVGFRPARRPEDEIEETLRQLKRTK